VDFIFLDYSSACDTVSHLKLLDQLKSIEIFYMVLKIIVNFLKKNRKQFVNYENFSSQLYDVVSGIIQSGKLFPTLFIIYVRKLVDVVKFSKLFQFTDDNVILKPIYSVFDTELLQNDLNCVQE
jgi:hypothetical protein